MQVGIGLVSAATRFTSELLALAQVRVGIGLVSPATRFTSELLALAKVRVGIRLVSPATRFTSELLALAQVRVRIGLVAANDAVHERGTCAGESAGRARGEGRDGRRIVHRVLAGTTVRAELGRRDLGGDGVQP